MLKYIKTKLFGSKLFQRTASANMHSKQKASQEDKRPLSIDSKQKKMQSKSTTPPHQCPQVIQMQSLDPYQHRPPQLNQSHHDHQDMACLLVSEEGSLNNHDHDLLLEEQPNLLEGLSQSVNEWRQVEPATNPRRKQIFPNYMEEAMTHQTISRNGKILIKRSPEKKVIKRIQQQCSLCKKTLIYSDSIQLACTHRCHKACSVKMQWRMKYTCDLCESRNERRHLASHK